jgi:hypothetical protein
MNEESINLCENCGREGSKNVNKIAKKAEAHTYKYAPAVLFVLPSSTFCPNHPTKAVIAMKL